MIVKDVKCIPVVLDWKIFKATSPVRAPVNFGESLNGNRAFSASRGRNARAIKPSCAESISRAHGLCLVWRSAQLCGNIRADRPASGRSLTTKSEELRGGKEGCSP